MGFSFARVAYAITDFHSHLIPGVDDGARSPADSAAALAKFRSEGVGQVITTPHFLGSLTQDRERCDARLAEIDAGWEVLQGVVAADAARDGRALRVERGVELMLDVPVPDLSDERLRLAGGRFVLVEFPMMRLPPVNAEFAIEELIAAGWTPVVAHPERYRNLDPSLRELESLRRSGALFQLNAGSLFGDYGKSASALARAILAAGEADFVSSDYHTRGEPGARRFAQSISELGFTEQVELLTVTNPGRLLDGEMPVPVPPIALKPEARSPWQRLFG